MLYSKNGFLKTSMDEISAHAKVAKGTLFIHFKNQEELICTVLEQLLVRFSEEMQKHNATMITLKSLLQFHLTTLEAYEELYKHLIIERTLLPEQVTYTYIQIQSLISHHFDNFIKKEYQIKGISLSFVYTTWIGIIHYHLSNYDLFGNNESIIKQYRVEWIENYLALLDKNGGNYE